tara:strand:+ start:641 stop:991 length:351 start_codon:yes stop_codon:yes gene_type:complete
MMRRIDEYIHEISAQAISIAELEEFLLLSDLSQEFYCIKNGLDHYNTVATAVLYAVQVSRHKDKLKKVDQVIRQRYLNYTFKMPNQNSFLDIKELSIQFIELSEIVDLTEWSFDSD